MQLPVNLIEFSRKKNKRILLVDLKLNHEDIHLRFHKSKLYKKIVSRNFLISINKKIKLLTGLSYYLKNNDEEERKKIITQIEKNAKKYDKVIIEILENNFPEITQKIIEKTEKYIFIFSNHIQDIKHTREKIDQIHSKKIYLFLNKEKQIKNQQKISIEILKEIFKKAKIIRKEKQIWK